MRLASSTLYSRLDNKMSKYRQNELNYRRKKVLTLTGFFFSFFLFACTIWAIPEMVVIEKIYIFISLMIGLSGILMHAIRENEIYLEKSNDEDIDIKYVDRNK